MDQITELMKGQITKALNDKPLTRDDLVSIMKHMESLSFQLCMTCKTQVPKEYMYKNRKRCKSCHKKIQHDYYINIRQKASNFDKQIQPPIETIKE